MFPQRMEMDFWKPLLRQPHVVLRGGQKRQRVGGIPRHARRVGVDEGGEFGRGVGGDPARAGVLAAFQADVRVVFTFEAVLHHLKLQLPHRTEQHVAAHFRAEHLDRAFFPQLRQALLQLFGAQGVAQHDGHEQFRRKKRQAGELQVDAAVGDGVAQL
jgi:hypothetical protein